MDSADLDLFTRVMAMGSFSEAARALDLTPAAVSKRIARLEKQLDVRLFQRTTRQLTATAEGAAFHRHAQRILADIDAARDAMSHRASEPAGLLRVTAPASFGRMHISPIVPAFLERYPEVELDLSLTDGLVDLVEEGFDLAIRIVQPEDSSMIARWLAPNRRVLCAAPKYLERYGAPQTPSDLTAHNCLVMHHQLVWTLESPEGEERVRVSGSLQTNNAEVLRDAAVAGLGIARKSTWDVGHLLQAGDLVPVLPEYSVSTHVAIHAMYPSARFLPPRVSAFIEFLQDRFGNPPYWDRIGGIDEQAIATG